MNPGAVILKCLATAFPSLKIEQLKDINTMYTINTVSYLKMQTGKWEWWHFLCRSQWYFTLHVCLTIQTGISSFLQGMGMSVWGKSNNWFKKTNKQTHLFMTQLSKLFFSSFFFFLSPSSSSCQILAERILKGSRLFVCLICSWVYHFCICH